MLKCLVIEDDAETLRFLCSGLQCAGFEVTPCANGPDAVRHSLDQKWDVIVLDRLLPGNLDGLAVLERFRANGNVAPVLILSALSSVDERVHGLRAGGDDYLTKPFAFPELVARIENLLRRAAATERDITQLEVADLLLDRRSMRATRAGRVIHLQPREFRLLEYLMEHRGHTVTRAMLLKAVWDYNFDPLTNVIDVQISRLRCKIDKGFSPTLIHTVRGEGYTLAVQNVRAGCSR